MSSRLYAYRVLRLRLGVDGPVLTLIPGSARQDSDLTARTLSALDGRWRWGRDEADGLAGGSRIFRLDAKRPEPIRNHVFVEEPTTHPPDHPALDVAAWVVEGSSPSDPTLTVRVEDGPAPDGFSEGFEADPKEERLWKVSPGFAGTVWIRHGDARLALGIFPRNLASAEEVRSATRGEGDAPLASALRRLDTIVRDLWSRSLHRGEPDVGASVPGANVQSGALRPEWFQRLARLHELVVHRGVRDAWQAIAADPVVRLFTEYPVVPMIEARVPVVHGARGPWSLPGGWSPDHPTGAVRERVVHRTTDTPPNRLAVALAARVVEEVDDILAGAPRASAGGGADPRILAIAEPLRQAALDTMYAPAFHGLDPFAPLALDTPSLQTNVRCRPLLDAWYQMTQGIAPASNTLKLDDLMLEPLARAHELYERWCFVRLVEIVSAILNPEGPIPEAQDADPDENAKILKATCTSQDGSIQVHVYHAADGALELSGDPDEDEPTGEGQRYKSTSTVWTNKLTHSWSPVSRPDGFIVVRRPREGTEVVHAWDAKYRPLWEGKSRDAGYIYQAHAFRDAIRWGSGTNGTPIQWSLVFHPGLAGRTIDLATYPTSGNGNATSELEEITRKKGGVAIAALRPPEANGKGHESEGRPPPDGAERLVKWLLGKDWKQ